MPAFPFAIGHARQDWQLPGNHPLGSAPCLSISHLTSALRAPRSYATSGICVAPWVYLEGSPFSQASVLGDRISVTQVTHHELKIFPLHTDASNRTWALSDDAYVVCGCRAAAGDVCGGLACFLPCCRRWSGGGGIRVQRPLPPAPSVL